MKAYRFLERKDDGDEIEGVVIAESMLCAAKTLERADIDVVRIEEECDYVLIDTDLGQQ